MFSLQTFFNACFNLKHNVVAVLTALAITALFVTFPTNAAQALHEGEPPIIIGITVGLNGALNCKDASSLEAGKIAIMNSDGEAWNKTYAQTGCYRGGKVIVTEKARSSFNSSLGTWYIAQATREDGTIVTTMVRNEILTQTEYDLLYFLVIGEMPSVQSFAYCNSAEDTLAVLEKARQATEKNWNDFVGSEFRSRDCASMKTEDSMVTREQISEDITVVTRNIHRGVRISREGAEDIFAIIIDLKVFTTEQAAAIREKK